MQFLLHIEVTWPPDGDPGGEGAAHRPPRRSGPASSPPRASSSASGGSPGSGPLGPLGGGRRDGAPRGHHVAADVALPRRRGLPARRPPQRPGRPRVDERARLDDGLAIPSDYVANLFDLAGRVAVITGGGSGLGRAIAIGYAQAGVGRGRRRRQRRGRRRDRRGCIARAGPRGARPRTSTSPQRLEAEALADAVVETARARGHPRQQRGLGVPLARRGVPRGQARLHPRPQPQGHVPVLPGVRAEDARPGQGQHHQPRLDRLVRRVSRGRAPTSPRRAACSASPARWRSSGATGACASTASARR